MISDKPYNTIDDNTSNGSNDSNKLNDSVEDYYHYLCDNSDNTSNDADYSDNCAESIHSDNFDDTQSISSTNTDNSISDPIIIVNNFINNTNTFNNNSNDCNGNKESKKSIVYKLSHHIKANTPISPMTSFISVLTYSNDTLTLTPVISLGYNK